MYKCKDKRNCLVYGVKMNIRNLLEEIKLGEENFNTLKHIEDIKEDFVIDEEKKFFRSNKRLKKIIEKIESKKIDGINTILEELRRISKILLPIEKKLMAEEEIRKSEARAKIIEIKRSYDRITSALKDNKLLKEIKQENTSRYVGEAVGTILFAIKPLYEVAGTTKATELKRERIPFVFKEHVKDELKFLKRAMEKGYEELPI
jgi:hypothetical protein